MQLMTSYVEGIRVVTGQYDTVVHTPFGPVSFHDDLPEKEHEEAVLFARRYVETSS